MIKLALSYQPSFRENLHVILLREPSSALFTGRNRAFESYIARFVKHSPSALHKTTPLAPIDIMIPIPQSVGSPRYTIVSSTEDDFAPTDVHSRYDEKTKAASTKTSMRLAFIIIALVLLLVIALPTTFLVRHRTRPM